MHRVLGPQATRGPRKGFFTQCVCSLFDVAPSRADLSRALSDWDGLREVEPASDGNWALAVPAVVVDYRADVNGFVEVDVVDRPWPDRMGSPDAEPELFAAWSMGHFGPCTFPGALERAIAHAHRWPETREIASRHRAFVRVRSSYIFGVADDAPVQPTVYDAIDELRFVSEVQLALTQLAGHLCPFNPNGELLVPADQLEQRIAEADELVPVDAWSNVRMFRSPDGKWMVYDTVGLEQIDVSDHEAVLPLGHPSNRHVPGLLYSMASYDAKLGGVVGPNDTASDLDDTQWRARATSESVVAPPRSVLRWSPEGIDAPATL